VRIAHILKFCNALCLLSNSTVKNVLLCGRKAVRKEGDKFHHKICCTSKCCTVEGLMDEVDSNALMFLDNFHVNCSHNLALGLGRRGGIIGRSGGKRGSSLGCFRAIPNVLELEAKSNRRAIWVKPMQKIPSRSSVRWQTLVCLCKWNNQPILEMKGAWIDWV